MAHPPEDLRDFLGSGWRRRRATAVRQEVDPHTSRWAAFIRHSENAGEPGGSSSSACAATRRPVVANLYADRPLRDGGRRRASADDLARLRRDPRASAGGLASFLRRRLHAERDRSRRRGAAARADRGRGDRGGAGGGRVPPRPRWRTRRCQESSTAATCTTPTCSPRRFCEGDAAHSSSGRACAARPDSGVLNAGCHRHQVRR